jgi:chromosome segregation ATPase
MSDKTKYESIKVLNTALMERLGKVTGELHELREGLGISETEGLLRQDMAELKAENERLKAELQAVVTELKAQKKERKRLELKPTPAEKKAMDGPQRGPGVPVGPDP